MLGYSLPLALPQMVVNAMHGKAHGWAADEWRAHGAMMPACLAGVMLVAVHGYALGVMIQPLEQEFGWTRAQISAGPMIPALASLVLAPLVGAAVDRLGPRRIALFGVPFFCVTLALLATATPNIASWWALYALLGFASMFVLPTIWSAAINARFDKNRGLALAIALTGTGVAAALIPMTAARLVEWQGWRAAYVGIGLMCFLLVFPLVVYSFDRDGLHARSSARAPRVGLRSEFFSFRYVMLASAALLFASAACVLTVNAVPILLGEGFAPLRAAEIAGLVGVGTIIGRLAGGFLLDRFDGRFVAAACGLAPMVGAALLVGTHESQAAAMIAVLAIGIAGGTEYDACAYLTSRHFGMRNFGALFGLIGGMCLFGAGLAPVLSNHVYDLTQSYDVVLWAMMPAFAVAAVCFLLIGPYPAQAPLDRLQTAMR